ncbi:MAG TPA: metallophosphoesterase [Planctomycetota bacterium]|nr:metallophosphoesterase [Planctomycetota bacterium]
MAEPDPQPSKWTRRRILKTGFFSGLGLLATGVGYSLAEACWIEVVEQKVAVPGLPDEFSGLRVAFLSDIHHGPYTGLSYVKKIVERALAAKPDLILLGGDYVHRDEKYIAPCFNELAALKAPLGVFGVLGNHDHWENAALTRSEMKSAGIGDLTNAGVWLMRGAARLRVGGVGDLWCDEQDLDAALGDATGASIVLSHNPDFAESVTDPRVGLVLSGHTHGGQVVLPPFGAPFVPSRYGQKYLRGLVQAPKTLVYVTRGLGTITPPTRFCCRPELTILTAVGASRPHSPV